MIIKLAHDRGGKINAKTNRKTGKNLLLQEIAISSQRLWQGIIVK